MNLYSLFDRAVEQKASDIHISTGSPVCYRVEGNLVPVNDDRLDRESIVGLVELVLPPDALFRIQSGLSFERTVVHNGFGFMGVFFRCGADGMAVTFRILSNQIPALEQASEGAEGLFRKIVDTPRGFVLIVGPVGSGKTTTAWSVVETINIEKPTRIVAVTGHAGYVLQSKRSMVTELQVGQDCESYEKALSIADMTDIDVLALDDLPNAEVLRLAMDLADRGHLVIANLHADGVLDAFRRLFDGMGADGQSLRRALSKTLIAITAQRLMRRIDRNGRVPAFEYLESTPGVREAILAGDIAKIGQRLSSESGARTLGSSLDELVASGKASEEAAAVHRN